MVRQFSQPHTSLQPFHAWLLLWLSMSHPNIPNDVQTLHTAQLRRNIWDEYLLGISLNFLAAAGFIIWMMAAPSKTIQLASGVLVWDSVVVLEARTQVFSIISPKLLLTAPSRLENPSNVDINKKMKHLPFSQKNNNKRLNPIIILCEIAFYIVFLTYIRSSSIMIWLCRMCIIDIYAWSIWSLENWSHTKLDTMF